MRTVDHATESEGRDLYLPEAVEDAMTWPLVDLLRDPEMTNVHICVDGSVMTMRRGGSWSLEEGLYIDDARVDLILASLSGALGTVNNSTAPITVGALGRLRITGFGPSVANGRRSLSMRVLPPASFTLDQLVERGMLAESSALELVRWLMDGRTVVVAGKGNSGKTTLARALLREYLKRRPLDRVVTLEERSPELGLDLEARAGQSREGLGVTTLVAHANGSDMDMTRLLRGALTASADAIVIGEVAGAEAWVLLRALRSGHKGSVATIHAGSAMEALEQLASYARDAGVQVLPEAFARVVDLVVHVTEDGGIRRVSSLDEVGLDASGAVTLRRIA